ncbi:uncharacterized protein PRCAT00001436001 [Priceomyces carsonii]|uniref:uncharacterized protein n=1 Tax=Priceomyces carsonii TaxID=28549 RepID=UPI002EDA9FCA|nr:unnamed protein product [Priceomyces carsonii]
MDGNEVTENTELKIDGFEENEYSERALGKKNMRKDLKPLLIEQPEGPSFTVIRMMFFGRNGDSPWDGMQGKAQFYIMLFMMVFHYSIVLP